MPRADVKDEENRIRQILLDMGDAFQRKDVDSFMSCFHRDAVALYPDTPLVRGAEPWCRFIEEAVRDNISVKYDEVIVNVS
ncbi:MAG TPA: hypothetical protein VGB32_11600 [Candidatus Bathyarchaeia archaeon]